MAKARRPITITAPKQAMAARVPLSKESPSQLDSEEANAKQTDTGTYYITRDVVRRFNASALYKGGG